jgi:hypothetical protein
MAKYRAKAALYVGSRLIAPGETFTSDDVPGKEWEPLDDAGKAAHDERHNKSGAKHAAKPAPAASFGRAHVEKKDA